MNKRTNSLTQDQMEFLQNHHVSDNLIFNAFGLSKQEYREQMKKEGKIVAYNVSPCQKAGHTLRTRSGHCVQCTPSHLGFQKRNEDLGYVYIAGSVVGRLIKVGFTSRIATRSESLNRTKYGSLNDWEILFAVNSSKGGRLENDIKKALGSYAFQTTYYHDGKEQVTDEVFKCSYMKAKEKFVEILDSGNYDAVPHVEKAGKKYNFSNLIRVQQN